MICAKALDFGINSVVRALSMTKTIQQDIYKTLCSKETYLKIRGMCLKMNVFKTF